MPKLQPLHWPRDKVQLCDLGWKRCADFCRLNDVPLPPLNVVARKDWVVSACAFYRPDTAGNREWMSKRDLGTGPGISICLELCQVPCGDDGGRNWSWPGNTVDRTVYGVLCHELAHHLDWLTGEKKGKYFSDWCEQVKNIADEPGLTSYADENPAEYLAESGRLFLTNPTVLQQLRPRTYAAIAEKFNPLTDRTWLERLGENVPLRVVKALRNKGVV